MIIFNITFKVDHETAGDWLAWLQENVTPLIEKEPAVINHKILKLLMDDETGVTYCIQHSLTGVTEASTYENNTVNLFLRDMYSRFEGKVVHFSTALEEIS